MKEKIKAQKGLIQIPLLIAIIISIVVTAGIGYGAVEYKKVSGLVKEADQLAREEKYDEAIEKLGLAQVSFFVEKLSVNEKKINEEIAKNQKLFADKSKYDRGLDKFNKDNLQEAINLLSEFSESSFYYQKSQTKIEESKRKLVEEELTGEKIVRKEAQVKAQQETVRRTQEEAARIVAEEKTRQEEAAKKVAQEKAELEEIKRIREETARKQAEQQTASERLAKEQQQREAEIQRQRADQEEKARVLELAKTHPQIKAIVSGELKFYIDPLPSYAATGVSNEVESVATSFSSWNIYGAPVRRVYNSNDADLTVSWVRDYGSHTIGEAIYRAHVKVGLGSNNCVGDWSAFDATTVKKVLWHELGHSMGYGHSSNPNNVMYSETAIRFEIDQIISGVISGGWYKTIPLCGAGNYLYSFETADPYGGFDLFVLPPGQDAYEISGGSGLYYPDCGAKGMRSYSDSCIVANGAEIYIGNTSARNTIRLSGKIINMDNPPWPDMTWDQSVFQYDSNQLTKYWELFH